MPRLNSSWRILLMGWLAQNACAPVGGGGGGNPGSFSKGFVFARRDDRNLYLADQSDYSKTIKLTTNGGNSQPSFSSDATRVAFVHTDNGVSEIDVLGVAAAGNPATLVIGTDSLHQRFRTPVFSPGGLFLVFSYDNGGTSYLGRINVDGTGFQQLTSGVRSYSSPSFYADGVNLLAISGSNSSVYTAIEQVNLNTPTNPSTVASTLGGADSIANRVVLSPDGNKAAFDGRIGSGTRIFMLDLSSSNITQVTDYPAAPSTNDTFPTWVGNGSIGFSSDYGGGDGIYVLSSTAVRSSGGLTVPSAIEPSFGPN